MKRTRLEVLGEVTSVAWDLAGVDIGAAQLAIARAAAARTPLGQARAWRRVADECKRAIKVLAEAELAALERAREAVASEQQKRAG